MNIRSQRHKRTDSEILEIYNKIVERHKKYGVPLTHLIKGYGLISWSALRQRIERQRGKKW